MAYRTRGTSGGGIMPRFGGAGGSASRVGASMRCVLGGRVAAPPASLARRRCASTSSSCANEALSSVVYRAWYSPMLMLLPASASPASASTSACAHASIVSTSPSSRACTYALCARSRGRSGKKSRSIMRDRPRVYVSSSSTVWFRAVRSPARGGTSSDMITTGQEGSLHYEAHRYESRARSASRSLRLGWRVVRVA